MKRLYSKKRDYEYKGRKRLVTGDIGRSGQTGRCRVGENIAGREFYRGEACVERCRDAEKG